MATLASALLSRAVHACHAAHVYAHAHPLHEVRFYIDAQRNGGLTEDRGGNSNDCRFPLDSLDAGRIWEDDGVVGVLLFRVRDE